MPTVSVSDAAWRKSRRSGAQNANCVEIATVRGAVAIRDSKNKEGPVLFFSPNEWSTFVEGVKTSPKA